MPDLDQPDAIASGFFMTLSTPMTRIAFLLLSACLVLSLGSCGPDSSEHAIAQPKTAHIVIIDLHGYVGCGIDASLIEHGLAQRLAALIDPLDAVVFSLRSEGGMLNRVGPLSDLIHQRVSSQVRCIGWIERAESAAALLALTIPELVMPPDGIIGGAVGVRLDPLTGRWIALPESDQEAVRFIAAACAARGGHDRDLALRLTTPRPDQNGAQVLTLTGREAADRGLAKAYPSLESSLDGIFGEGGWTVDQETSRDLSESVARAESERVRIIGLQQRFDAAIRIAEDGGGIEAVEVADGYYDLLLEIAVSERPESVRAAVFLGLLEWTARAGQRLRDVSGESQP